MVSSLLIFVNLRWLWPALTRGQRTVLAVASPVVLFAVTISRLEPGWHWPSDVLGGWLLGVIWAVWAVPLICRPVLECAGTGLIP
jgi:membrane-associated phospholipid phosphatase